MADEIGPDGKEWAKTRAGYDHVEAVKPKADGLHGLAPWFYGWAVREAFVAGAEWQESRGQSGIKPLRKGLDATVQTAEKTFVRVYRLPEKLINGYCFETGTGNPITMQNVDWFDAPVAIGRDQLTAFIKSKRYYSATADFLVLGDHADFIFRIPREEQR